MDRSEWLAARRTCLCSTDAAALCGRSRWLTPLHVYVSKVEGLDMIEQTEEMEWGTLHEPLIAQKYQERTGHLVRPPAQKLLRHTTLSYLGASLDYLATYPDDGDRILECKCSDRPGDWGPEGTDQVPDDYNLQVQHQLLVTGLVRADIAVLLSGNRLKIYHVERHTNLLDQLVNIEADFWHKHVEPKLPPAPDWSHPATPELIRYLHGVDPGLTIDMGDAEALELIAHHDELSRAAKEFDRSLEVVKAKLLHKMGPATEARLPTGHRLQRRTVPSKAISYTRKEYVDFRVQPPRKKDLEQSPSPQ